MSRFVWFEHVSTDASAAQRFYADLFGWTTMPHGDYVMIAQGDISIGAYREPRVAESHAHWLPLFGVASVADASAKTTSLGGTLVTTPTKVADIATTAVATDPFGAVFGLWQSATAAPAEGDGRFCWNELYTTQLEASVAFYRGITGLDEESLTLGDQPYTMLMDGKAPVAGLCPPPPFDPPLGWQPVVAVPDADASHAKAALLGAKILAPIEDVPSIGRFFVLADPLGAVLGILQRA